MGSLAGCLRLHNITGAEAAYLRKLSGEYKSEGFTPQERNERAAQDVLKLQLDSHADIVRQIKQDVTETPQSNIQEPISDKAPELAPAIPPDGKINAITREEAGRLIKEGNPAVADHIRSGLYEGIAPMQMQDAIRNQTLAEIGKADTKEERQQIRANIAKIGPEISAALKSQDEPTFAPTPERLAFVRDMMTETAGPTKLYGPEGEVAGRSKSQRPKWLQDTVSEYMLKYPKARAIIDRFLSGGDMTPNQQKFINDVVNRSASNYEKIKDTYEAKPQTKVMGLPVTEGKLSLKDRAALLERSGQQGAADKLRATEGFLTAETPTQAKRKPTQQGLPMDTTSGDLEGKLPEGKAYEPTGIEKAQREAAGRATQAEEVARQGTIQQVSPGKSITLNTGSKVQIGKSPQSWTITKVLSQSANDKAMGEQYFEAVNNKTKEKTTFEKGDIKTGKGKDVYLGSLLGGLQEYIDSGKPQAGYARLVELGKHIYQQGHDTGTKFFKAMREHLGKMWNAYKKQVVKVWTDVKKWNTSLGESGAIRNPFAKGEHKLSAQGQKVLDFLQAKGIKNATPDQFKRAGVSEKEANLIYEKLKSPAKLKERKLYETFQKSETTTEGMKEELSKVVNKDYIVKPNIESLAEADKLIADNRVSAEKSVMTDAPLTAVKAATFIRLIHEYQQQGNYSEAVGLFEEYAKQATEAGQGIQIAAVWNRLTPEGFLKWAEKQINKTKENQSWINKVIGRKASDLTPDDKAKILEEVNRIHKLPKEEQNKAWTDLIDTIALKLPPTWSEILDAYRYQNMLSGWQTHERNIGENMFNTWITRPWEITTEGSIDYVKSTLTGKERTAYATDVADYYKTAFNALPNAVDAFLNAWHGRTDLSKPEVGVEVKGELEKARFRQMPKYLTVVARFMEASDRFNTTLIAAGQYAVGKKNGLSDTEASDKAHAIAENYLYRDKLNPKDRNLSIPSKALAGFGDIILKSRKEPGVLGTVMSWMIPFVRTPINKGIAMIERSPLGLVRTSFNNEAIARVMTGGVITAIGTVFALMGASTWSAPDDEEEKKVFYATGRKPFSIRIGDSWVPAWYFGPFALALALPAAVKHHYRDSKKSISHGGVEKLVGTVSAVARFISSQTSAQSIENFIKLVNGDIDYSMKGNLAFTAGQFFPASGMLRNINKLVDPAIRKPDSFLEHMKKDVPFASQGLIQRTDPLGQPVERLRANALLPYEISPSDKRYENIYAEYQAERRVKYVNNKIKSINLKVRKGLMSPENADKQFEVIVENLAGLDLKQDNRRYKMLNDEEEE